MLLRGARYACPSGRGRAYSFRDGLQLPQGGSLHYCWQAAKISHWMRAVIICNQQRYCLEAHGSCATQCRQQAASAETQHRRCCEREAAVRRTLAEREAEVEHLTELTASCDATVRGVLSRLKVLGVD